MLWYTVLICSLVPSALTASFPVPRSSIAQPRETTIDYRLPTNLKPLHYDVTLEPFFSPDFNFNGEVNIEVEVLEDTSTIVLHGYNLEINLENVAVKLQNDINYFRVSSLDYEEDRDFYIISLDSTLNQGETIVIEILYIGYLNEFNKGFYRASYLEDGVEKWFGTTQFESTSAREAFPCFDEPALKATFTINIIRPASYNSISNMKLKDSSETQNGKIKDTFETSVVMSTYLVAFVVSEMDFVESGNQRVYAAKYLIDDGRGAYGVDVGIETIRAMEEFTGVDYALDKMYQVAIPDDWFAAGAMENWGLVTYKERYLLYKEGLTTASEKQNVASIIAHEFGHQWFGDLVSPLWWKYIWLNEGFATYFEHYATHIVEPDMRMMEQFVTATVHYAFESDSLESTRPMSFDAESKAEIGALFDRIAYQKSGSVIRMMENFLTTTTFKRGLNLYLINMEYKSAQPSDLWNGLQSAVDELNSDVLGEQKVSEIMETWNSQAGYPVVNVERDSDGRITLSQDRFLLNNATHELATLWTIPINYATESSPDFADTTPALWLKTKSENTDITVDNAEWIILNKQETGYYRVNYDEDNWNLLIDYLNSDNYNKIHVLNRAQLIDDSFNLARSGRLNYRIPLRLAQYLSRETDYIPLYTFFTRALQFLNNHLAATDSYDLFKDYVKELLQTAHTKLGAADTGSHTEKLNRNNVINWLCRFEDQACLEAMHNKLSSETDSEPDLQAAAYCGGMRSSSGIEEKWLTLYQRYKDSTTESMKRSRVLSGLGCALNTAYLVRLLDIATNNDGEYTISTSDRVSAFSAVYTSSDVGLETALNYVIDNFENMISKFLPNQIQSIINGMASRIASAEDLSKFRKLTEEHIDPSSDLYSIFNTAIRTIATNVEWSETYTEGITEWLKGSATFMIVSLPLLLGSSIAMLMM